MKTRQMILAAVTVVAAACAGEGDGYRLRLGHDQNDQHPYHLAVQRFADRVSEATQGEVRITIFPAAQLGDSPEQLEGLHLGTLDLALAAFSHASQFCSEFGLFGAPYLFESNEHFAAVFDGEVGQALDDSCHQDYGLRLLSTFTSGYRVLFNGSRPVRSAADLNGLKVRVMGGEADAQAWEVFGALPVPMPYSEVYAALQAGVIDGAENEPVSILSNRFYEAAHYFTETDHLVLPMGLFISQETLDELPPEYQEILWREAREAAVWERDRVTRDNAAALVEMRDRYGVEISTIDTDELRQRSIGIQDAVARDLGVTDLLEKVRAAAGQDG